MPRNVLVFQHATHDTRLVFPTGQFLDSSSFAFKAVSTYFLASEGLENIGVKTQVQLVLVFYYVALKWKYFWCLQRALKPYYIAWEAAWTGQDRK